MYNYSNYWQFMCPVRCTVCIPFHMCTCTCIQGAQDSKKKAVSSALGGGEEDDSGKLQEEEEKRIRALMKGMASAGTEEVSSYLYSMYIYM